MNKIIFDDVEYEFQIVPRKEKESEKCQKSENFPVATVCSASVASNVTEASTVPSCVSSVVPTTTTTTKVKTPKSTFALVVGVIANALISVFEILVNLGVI